MLLLFFYPCTMQEKPITINQKYLFALLFAVATFFTMPGLASNLDMMF